MMKWAITSVKMRRNDNGWPGVSNPTKPQKIMFSVGNDAPIVPKRTGIQNHGTARAPIPTKYCTYWQGRTVFARRPKILTQLFPTSVTQYLFINI
ncbi:hypothetical protein HNQ80_001270 [Anaerosolibacter carboniphilus]|uniref:Uncharacterized protein n=1 Tax=Anaerosolibacter carboniphilus TaxID=1417629 RepID=A0A841KPE3_9FIRM|nr:hypothetical protein [Anaerosolibacter carboniphilus]MBB6215181.1 hypothetical protein [Anaerosolibacter carboniphilus]